LIVLLDGDAVLIRELHENMDEDRLYFVNVFEGASWAEKDIGCNGGGSTIAAGQPMVFVGPEHLHEAYIDWTSIAIPLRDAEGAIIGALDLSIPNSHFDVNTWGWMSYISQSIEDVMADREPLPESSDVERKLSALTSPFNVVNGVLDFVAQEIGALPTHAQLLTQAKEMVRQADSLFVSTARELKEFQTLLRESNQQLVMATISSKDQAEEIEAARKQAVDVLESIADGFVAVDFEGHFTYVNGPAEKLLGKSRAELLGVSVWDLLPQEIMNELCKATHKVTVERAPAEVQSFLADPQRWIEGTVYPSKSGLSFYFRDITERKRMEQFREEMASLISHDLRNPLTIIQGQAQLAKRYAERPDLVRESADKIDTSARRMVGMIQDLSDSTKIESGQLGLARKPVSLNHFVSEMLYRLEGALDAHRIKLDIPGELPLVSVDPARLERILTNIIGNALKYSPAEADVMVTAERVEGAIQVSISDHGAGIASGDVAHIFERFYRANRTRHSDGLGLGLYIAKTMVEAHGGRIWVDSQPNKGSTFHFTLPLA
jgi:PAS domain S-box-containing protein